MKLHFMNEDSLNFLKGNIETFLPHYQGDNQWVEQVCSERGLTPFSTFKEEVPTFELNMTHEKPERSDYENVKILYLGLKNITDSQATDERFWAGLAHSDFWDFMMYRSKLSEGTSRINNIETNFFFMRGRKRSLFRHVLARLWWVGRLTYEEGAENPFAALEFLKVDFGTKVFSLFSSNFTNNPLITRSILKAIAKIEEDYGKITRDSFLELLRYVNLLGGIIILDYLTEEELIDKIVKHYLELNPKS